jgi:hypothetical protein
MSCGYSIGCLLFKFLIAVTLYVLHAWQIEHLARAFVRTRDAGSRCRVLEIVFSKTQLKINITHRRQISRRFGNHRSSYSRFIFLSTLINCSSRITLVHNIFNITHIIWFLIFHVVFCAFYRSFSRFENAFFYT